jgi:hypothetical protein
MTTLLTAPVYFKLKETEKGTVLVEDGIWKKEEISEKYGNRQHYFMDSSDEKLKCISGGSANFIIDNHNLTEGQRVKITYDGTETIENGKFAGNNAHQFKFELLEDAPAIAKEAVEEVKEATTKEENLEDLA